MVAKYKNEKNQKEISTKSYKKLFYLLFLPILICVLICGIQWMIEPPPRGCDYPASEEGVFYHVVCRHHGLSDYFYKLLIFILALYYSTYILLTRKNWKKWFYTLYIPVILSLVLEVRIMAYAICDGFCWRYFLRILTGGINEGTYNIVFLFPFFFGVFLIYHFFYSLYRLFFKYLPSYFDKKVFLYTLLISLGMCIVSVIIFRSF